MKNANLFAPLQGFPRKLQDFLSNKDAIIKSVSLLPASTNLRIYVIINEDNNILLHLTIKEYCTRFNIKYSEN